MLKSLDPVSSLFPIPILERAQDDCELGKGEVVAPEAKGIRSSWSRASWVHCPDAGGPIVLDEPEC